MFSVSKKEKLEMKQDFFKKGGKIFIFKVWDIKVMFLWVSHSLAQDFLGMATKTKLSMSVEISLVFYK